MGGVRESMIGQRFGQLVVVETLDVRNHHQYWLCQCDCGGTAEVPTCRLRRGDAKACHPSSFGDTRVGGVRRRTKEYRTWAGMLTRCTNPNTRTWRNYGGRGIAVCDRWSASYAAFLADMGRAPTPRHSIDRIDGNGNYEPSNCRWATAKEQRRNTAQKLTAIEFNGETKPVCDWADAIGLPRTALYQRIAKGWPIVRALTQSLARKGA